MHYNSKLSAGQVCLDCMTPVIPQTQIPAGEGTGIAALSPETSWLIFASAPLRLESSRGKADRTTPVDVRQVAQPHR